MERMSSDLRDAVAAYAASIDPVPRGLDRSWAAIEQRIAEEPDVDVSTAPAPDRAVKTRRWSIAAVAVAAAALVVAGMAHVGVVSLRERVEAAGALAPYVPDESDDVGEPAVTLETPAETSARASTCEPGPIVDPVASTTDAAPKPRLAKPSTEPSAKREPRRAAKPLVEPPASTLSAEVALLGKVRSALRDGDAVAALRGLEQHASTYPDGELREAARALRVSALCRAERKDDADRERVAFLRDHGSSPLAATVREVCVDRRGEAR
jgi:hypothetical protein